MFHRVVHLRNQAAQRQVVIASTVEGQREDGDIVDRSGFDQWKGYPMRHAVLIRTQLLGDLYQTRVRIGAHLEANDRQGLAFPRLRIEVLHPGHFPEQFLHRPRSSFLDLSSR